MFETDDFPQITTHDYKIGDEYKLYTINYAEHIDRYGEETEFYGREYYVCTVKHITITGGLILELNEDIDYGDGSFDTSIFTGKEIKEIIPDFNGDDDIGYCVLYEENSPFY